jgi:uncharacterized protein YjeT (DUF2065 family)
MSIILYAFSLIYIAAGVCMILYTNATRNAFRQLIQMGFKVLSVIAVVIGFLFLVSATASHYPWFLRFIGIFAVLEGVMLFVNPQDIMGRIYAWYLDEASDQTFRATGIITVIFGTALISWIV